MLESIAIVSSAFETKRIIKKKINKCNDLVTIKTTGHIVFVNIKAYKPNH